MKSAHNLLHWRLLLVFVLVLSSAMIGGSRVFASATMGGSAAFAAPSGSVTSSATPSNSAPSIGQQIVVTINIDMSAVNSPDNALGSFTGTLDWNTAVLSYNANSGILAGFIGNVNTGSVGSGRIGFNGINPSGVTGNITVLTITFNVVGGGTSALDLAYTAMAAASTFNSLLPILTVNDGSVVVSSPEGTPTLTPTSTVTATSTATPTRTPTPTSTDPPTPTLVIRFQPPSSTVQPGAGFVVNVMVDNVVDLGGYDFTVTFDPAVVHVQTVTLGSLLGSTGRTVGALGPQIDNVAGSFAFGGLSFGAPGGPNGTGTVALVNLRAMAAGSSALTFSAAQLTNTQATILGPLTLAPGLVTVSGQIYLPVLRKAMP